MPVGTLPLQYAGIELHDAPAHAAVVHDSIHDQTRLAWALRRNAQRYFRAGRNAAYRLATGKTYDELYGKRGAAKDRSNSATGALYSLATECLTQNCR